MERYYKFAGIELSVIIPEEKFYEDENRLKPFSVDAVKCPHVYKVEMVDVLDEPIGTCIVAYPSFCVYQEGEQRVRYIGAVENSLDGAYIRVNSCGKDHVIQVLNDTYPERITTKTILQSIEAEHLLAQNNSFILHCSYIERNGKAILFTAPSETGKSTQADLWNQLRGAKIINGDRAAIRIVDGQIYAEGIPFAGSSQYCENRSLPIDAIVYLGQALQTTIRKTEGYQAFMKIWEGVSVNSWDKKDVEQVSQVVSEVVQEIPIFHLTCTPDESAVIALEEALNKKR